MRRLFADGAVGWPVRRDAISARTARVVTAVIYGLVIVTGGLLADFAVNVVTGGSLPGPLDRYRNFAWPTIALVFLLSMAAAVRERLAGRGHDGDPAEVEPPVEPAKPAKPVTGPSNLPPVIGEFTGRTEDLAQLRALVPPVAARRPGPPVVATIYGPVGAGKSTLAVRFAHDMRHRYPDAQLYVHLQGFGPEPLGLEPLDTADALARLVRTLGVPGRDLPADLEGLAAVYRSSLEGKRAIVVLDHAVDEAQVKPLLPGAPTCLVLITSLQPLNLLTGSSQLRLGPMTEDEAIGLLARIAGDHVRSPENVEATKRVASLCGNLPLALSIAGVLLRRNGKRPVTDLEAQLTGEPEDPREDLLEAFRVGDRSVRAGFDISHEHLDERERTLFRRLRLLTEPTFGAEMAAALLDCPVDEANRLLERLVEEQVLERVGERRFTLQNLIGLYAEEKLREEPQQERQAALRRALHVYVSETMRHATLLDATIAEIAEDGRLPVGCSLDDQLGALDWFERERAHLLKVGRQAADIQAHDLVWRLAASLVPFFDLRGHRADWTDVQDAAMRAADADGSLAAKAWTELGAGRLHWLDRNHREALHHMEEALETAMASRWPRVEARARYLMGRIAHEDGQLDEALSRYDRAANLFQREGMVREQANTFLYMARLLHQRGTLDAADVLHLGDWILPGLASMPEELWVVRTIGRVADYLGLVCEELGDLEGAGTHYIRSGEAFRQIGFRYGYGRARRQLGRTRLRQGSARRALTFLEESVVLFRTIGDRQAEGLSLLGAGDAHLALQHERDARHCWQDALAALVETGAAEAAEVRSRLASLPD